MTQNPTNDLSRTDTRKAGRLETMPDDLFEDFKQAVAAYERESDETEAGTSLAPKA